MLEFLNLKPETFSLDISDQSLKIIKLRKSPLFPHRRGVLGLASFGEAEIKPGTIEGGEIKDEESLVKIIKESLKKVKGEKLKTNYVIASLPEEKAFLQVIQLPKMKEEELKEAVFFEAENYIPLPIDQVYLDSQVVQPFYNHLDHFDVLIAALPKKTVDSYISAFNKAGLITKVLEIESQANARALIQNGVSPFPVLLIDLGVTKTSFIIFSGYSLRFTSSSPISGQKITEAISQALGVNLAEAEKLKIEYGLSGKYRLKIKDGIERGKIFEAITRLLTDLIKQIKAYLSYYQSHASHEHLPPNGKGVEKILLCGGGANLKGLVSFLSSELKIPIEIANPWINILPEPLKEIPGLSFEKSLAFTTALGLALRGLKE